MQPNIPYFSQCSIINGACKILAIPALSFGSTTALPLDVLSSSPLLRYTGYVLVICPHSCDWYDNYDNKDILDRLLATVGTVMTST